MPDFLKAEKGLSPADTKAFASLAVDLNIAESPEVVLEEQGARVLARAALLVRSEAQRQALVPMLPAEED